MSGHAQPVFMKDSAGDCTTLPQHGFQSCTGCDYAFVPSLGICARCDEEGEFLSAAVAATMTPSAVWCPDMAAAKPLVGAAAQTQSMLGACNTPPVPDVDGQCVSGLPVLLVSSVVSHYDNCVCFGCSV